MSLETVSMIGIIGASAMCGFLIGVWIMEARK